MGKTINIPLTSRQVTLITITIFHVVPIIGLAGVFGFPISVILFFVGIIMIVCYWIVQINIWCDDNKLPSFKCKD
jgi:hypothetical protein